MRGRERAVNVAGVVELSLGGRGPKRGYVFDPHRLALPCWAEAGAGTPSLVVTIDRHFDLVPPHEPPARGLVGEALERHVRTRLDPKNVDHVLAAMEAGVVTHVIAVARAKPCGVVEGPIWEDSTGERHELVRAATIDALSADFGAAPARSARSASPEAQRAHRLLIEATQIVLDVDIDAFTTPSDADPTTIIPWPTEVIRQHLKPRGSEDFWSLVLGKCVALTVAREPAHCGGLVTMGRLFEAFALVMFNELLETDLP